MDKPAWEGNEVTKAADRWVVLRAGRYLLLLPKYPGPVLRTGVHACSAQCPRMTM